MTDLDTLTAQHKGKRVMLNNGAIKTVESFGYKCGPSGDNTVLINFTDGTWEYASLTTVLP